jgi:hypothetical protein
MPTGNEVYEPTQKKFTTEVKSGLSGEYCATFAVVILTNIR